VLQCVAVCCSVLCAAQMIKMLLYMNADVYGLYQVVCCSVL